MAARTSSLVHPKYKTKYSVKNWSGYEQGLRNRGDSRSLAALLTNGTSVSS